MTDPANPSPSPEGTNHRAHEARPPRHIQRLTLDYSSYEDRIQIRGVDQDEKVIVLWLTQRLCTMLVRAVLKVLNETVVATPPGKAGSAKVKSPQPEQAAAIQYLEQTKAELTKAPSPTVVMPRQQAQVPDALVDAIQLRRLRQIYIVNFNCGGEEIALPMHEPELRQFMRGLHNRYKAADWPIEGLWPDWFSESAHATYLSGNQIN